MLEKINGPKDIKALSWEEMDVLGQEIRQFLIEKISATGGHLASNLGVVELTMAIYRTFDLPEDKVIWDVGHQAYTHKILSGRKDFEKTIALYQSNPEIVEYLQNIIGATVNVHTVEDMKKAFELDRQNAFGKTIMIWNK